MEPILSLNRRKQDQQGIIEHIWSPLLEPLQPGKPVLQALYVATWLQLACQNHLAHTAYTYLDSTQVQFFKTGRVNDID